MVLHVVIWVLFGMAVSAVSLQLQRALVRKGFLTDRHVKLIPRACGIILVCFGLVIAIYGFLSGAVIANVSALLYILVGGFLIFARPQPKPAGALDGMVGQNKGRPDAP